MTGIARIVDFSGRPVDRAHLEMKTGKLAHRGPEGIHHWLEGNVGLGH
jgi:asparagine synthase (glutamine-hydrolysing)